MNRCSTYINPDWNQVASYNNQALTS